MTVFIKKCRILRKRDSIPLNRGSVLNFVNFFRRSYILSEHEFDIDIEMDIDR